MAEEVKPYPFNENFLKAMRKWIMGCPSCGGYGQSPPIPLDYIGRDGLCYVCGPIRELFLKTFGREFECYT